MEYVIGMILKKMVATESDIRAKDVNAETMVIHYYYMSKAIAR